MSLLTMVQRACSRIGLEKPTSAYSSTDKKIQQLVELCNEEGQELSERRDWQVLRRESTFNTSAQEDQGDIRLITTGLKYIIDNTIWNRTQRRPCFGERTPQEWQQLKSQYLTGPFSQFYIRKNRLLFTPSPAAGESCYFEYITKNWCSDSTEATFTSSYANDTDVSLHDEDIMLMGVIWRWKSAKGLDYEEDFNKYERRVTDLAARDGSPQIISMNGAQYGIQPGIIVPSGSWNVP